MKKIVLNIIVISFLLDIVIRPIPNGEITRAFLVLFQSSFFFLILIYNKIRFKGSIWINLTVLYFLLLIPFSTNLPLTINYYLKFSASLLMFYYGINLEKNSNGKAFLEFSTKIIYIAVIYVIYSNLFDYGVSIYRGQLVKSGFLEAPFFYAPALALVLYTYLNKPFKSNKLDYIFLVSLMLFFILLFRRTIYVVLVIGFLIPILKGYNLKKHVKKVLLLGTVLVALFPLYQDILMASFSARGMKDYSNLGTVSESENRIVEYIFVYNEIKENVLKLLFGSGELFNSPGNYSFFNNTRPLHSDYSRLLFGGGIIGLLLYSMIFINIFFRTLIKSNRKHKREKTVIYIIISICFVTGLSGNITFLTFKAYLMIVLGIYYTRLTSDSTNRGQISSIAFKV